MIMSRFPPVDVKRGIIMKLAVIAETRADKSLILYARRRNYIALRNFKCLVSRVKPVTKRRHPWESCPQLTLKRREIRRVDHEDSMNFKNDLSWRIEFNCCLKSFPYDNITSQIISIIKIRRNGFPKIKDRLHETLEGLTRGMVSENNYISKYR